MLVFHSNYFHAQVDIQFMKQPFASVVSRAKLITAMKSACTSM